MERLLDAAHALMPQGVHRYPRKRRPDLRSEERARRSATAIASRPTTTSGEPSRRRPRAREADVREERRRAPLELPQENILYFLEKSAPRLESWQREILRIVRHIAQYFYPQRQTKVMNEGCATYCHYRILTRLHERGQIGDGAFLEFLQSHTNVIRQPAFDDPHYSGINPYALGFAMMQDIERICTKPTPEDREWFPDIAGRGDAMQVLRDVWANYRDESFIAQFLSPNVIRQWRMFHLVDDPDAPELRVDAIHDELGYRRLRRVLARHHDVAWSDPDIQVTDVDLAGDRRLIVHHNVLNGALLRDEETMRVLQHLADLWGYDVVLREVDSVTGSLRKEHSAQARPIFF